MRMGSLLLVISLAAFSFGQAPPATDPHEDPHANGGTRTGDSNPAPRDPHAVPDPVPVRAPNPDAPAADRPSAGAKRPTDSEIMRNIRAALRKDPAVSRSLNSVKVIAHAGSVTLQGTAPSAEALHAIEQKATTIAGAGKVTNEIKVQTRAPKHAVAK